MGHPSPYSLDKFINQRHLCHAQARQGLFFGTTFIAMGAGLRVGPTELSKAGSLYRRYPVETAIGVFSSRERAVGAVRELLDGKVPQESIVFLTRSETEAKTVGKELGATVGGFMGVGTGMSAGVAAATLLAVSRSGGHTSGLHSPLNIRWRLP